MKTFNRFLKSPDNTISVAAMLIGSALIVAIVVACASSASAQTMSFGAPRDVSGFAGWVLSKQAIFYRALSGTILAAKNDGSALWTLMGISFVYGVFHAAGPGHGKAVISSYLLANDETWRRGVTLSFASALVQSLTAVLIVGVAAVLLGGTAKMMGQAVRVIEITSYGLIVALGARLLWVKGLGFVRAVAALRNDAMMMCGISPSARRAVRTIIMLMMRMAKELVTTATAGFFSANISTAPFTVSPAITIIRTVMSMNPMSCHGVTPMARNHRSLLDPTAGSAVYRRSWRSDCGPVPAPSSCSCSRCRRDCCGPA